MAKIVVRTKNRKLRRKLRELQRTVDQMANSIENLQAAVGRIEPKLDQLIASSGTNNPAIDAVTARVVTMEGKIDTALGGGLSLPTRLTEEAGVGATFITVESTAGFQEMEPIVIGPTTPNEENNVVLRVVDATHLDLSTPTIFLHPIGETVESISTRRARR